MMMMVVIIRLRQRKQVPGGI